MNNKVSKRNRCNIMAGWSVTEDNLWIGEESDMIIVSYEINLVNINNCNRKK